MRLHGENASARMARGLRERLAREVHAIAEITVNGIPGEVVTFDGLRNRPARGFWGRVRCGGGFRILKRAAAY